MEDRRMTWLVMVIPYRVKRREAGLVLGEVYEV
jgi:hypothetical protein